MTRGKQTFAPRRLSRHKADINRPKATASDDEPAASEKQVAAKETPEHKVLARYIGDWDEEMTILPNASNASEMKVSSQNSRRWLLKETMVEEKSLAPTARSNSCTW